MPQFFTESDQHQMVAASILDPAWVTEVRRSPPPYFFAIEAVLAYLTDIEVRTALGLITEHFPGARIALDTGGRFMVDRQHRHPTMKHMSARMRWACDDPHDLERWNTGLRLRASCTFAQAPRHLRRRLPLRYRTLLRVLRIAVPPLITTYKLNLYTAEDPSPPHARPDDTE
jgi:O-methyltransferase involved in polyketide biosynthesis